MPVLLVRHAIAVARRDWDGPDELRPLSERGARQAEALVGQLAPFHVTRVLSSPSARCVATVHPLALARGVAVEEIGELAEGEAPAAARLARSCADADVVLCTHGDVVPVVLDELDGGALGLGRHVRCAKGSTWVLESSGGAFAGSAYLVPPA